MRVKCELSFHRLNGVMMSGVYDGAKLKPSVIYRKIIHVFIQFAKTNLDNIKSTCMDNLSLDHLSHVKQYILSGLTTPTPLSTLRGSLYSIIDEQLYIQIVFISC